MTSRKLQTEIDKTIKQIKQGIDIFNSTFEKIASASNQAQKEKFEGELKREIKKFIIF